MNCAAEEPTAKRSDGTNAANRPRENPHPHKNGGRSALDLALIRDRLEAVRAARRHEDVREIIYVINEGVHGNLGGIGDPTLFKAAPPQTRRLIRSYLEEMATALEELADSPCAGRDMEERIDLFRRASHCYGRSALMLSGAGSLTPFHLGVVKVLVEHEQLPKVISGSSGGAIVASLVATKSEAERRKFLSGAALDHLFSEACSRPVFGGKKNVLPLKFIDQDSVKGLIEGWIPDLTFAEAYEHSGLALNIPVTPANVTGSSRLLNAITAPHVLIRDAVMASTAVPIVHPSVELFAKGYDGRRRPYIAGQRWIDGSVALDLPSRRLARLYGVNHFITSQTNPVVLWILKHSGESGLFPRGLVDWATGVFRANLKLFKPLTSLLTRHFPVVDSIGLMIHAVAAQEYTADINIVPARNIVSMRDVLSPIPLSAATQLVAHGEAQCLPHLELIDNCTLISRTLDRIRGSYEHSLAGMTDRSAFQHEGADSRTP